MHVGIIFKAPLKFSIYIYLYSVRFRIRSIVAVLTGRVLFSYGMQSLGCSV